MGCFRQPINYILLNFPYIIKVTAEDITPATNNENVPKENNKFILFL